MEIITTTKRYCDFCNMTDQKTIASYDGKTKMKIWANMCLSHFKIYGIGLGLGKGQKLIYKER